MCCIFKNDLCSLHRCWQGDLRKLPEWTKKKIFCIIDAFWVPGSLFWFIWWSLRFLRTLPSLAGFKGAGLAVTALLNSKCCYSSCCFSDVVSLTCSGACHVEQLWSICHPSPALSNLNELAVWRKMAQNFPIPLLVFRRYLFFLGFRRFLFFFRIFSVAQRWSSTRICWVRSWRVMEISHLLLLCHSAGTTYVPNSAVPLRFPVSTCQIMGARQSAALCWGWSQRRGAKDVSKILSLGETLH